MANGELLFVEWKILEGTCSEYSLNGVNQELDKKNRCRRNTREVELFYKGPKRNQKI